jgi:type IV pilus assembly protein PilF
LGCSSNKSENPLQTQQRIDPVKAARTRISLALTYLENGNTEQAKFNLDKALEFAPFMADVHYSLAYYYQTVNEFKLANDAYLAALKRSPKNPDIINAYGAFLCEVGQYEAAQEYLLAAAGSANYSKIAETYENLAICAQAEIRLVDAIEYLERALNYAPTKAKSLRLMTELLLATDQWQEAKTYLRRLERSANVTPESLWMWVQIEHSLSNYGAASSYGETLVALYPESQQSERYNVLMNGQNIASEEKLSFTAVAPSQPQTETYQYHVVKAGENLYRISLAYGVKITNLINWNNLSDPSALKVGRELIVNKSEY